MSEQKKIGQSQISLIRDDLTMLEVDAFIFYAQHDLALGSGFGTAISLRGGKDVTAALEGKGPLETTEALVTGAGKLKAKHIIHAVGPRFQEEDLEGKLRSTMQNCLKRAEEKGLERLAFPPMGTGFYGVPLDLCARVMAETLDKHLRGETKIKEAIICVMDEREYDPFQARLSSLS